MKSLYFVAGTMGVGKTAVSRALQERLPDCVFLDGDWVWDSKPFLNNEETRSMALDNIVLLLTAFLRSQSYRNVVFCWVLHDAAIWDAILSRLPMEGVRFCPVILTCSEETLRERIGRDIHTGLRREDVLSRSLARRTRYDALPYPKIPTDLLSPEQIAREITTLHQ